MAPADRPHFVTTVHGLYSVNAYSGVMLRGERIIAVSRHARDYILANYPDVAPDRIQVIPRGIDPVRYPAGYRPGEAWLADWYRQPPSLEGIRPWPLARTLEDTLQLYRVIAGR